MWALFVTYGCCFGIEITIENIIVLYLLDYFDYFKQMDHGQALKMAGLLASFFGLMNIFARSLGGWLGDKCGNRWGLSGRVKWLFVALFCEGVALLFFSQATTLVVRHSAARAVRAVRQDVERRHVCRRAVRQSPRAGRRGRHRRGRRKRRRRARRVSCSRPKVSIGTRHCSSWER